MMDSSQFLETYETIALITGQMLDAARSGNWENLVALEQDCRRHVEKLTALETMPHLTGPDLEHKIELIHKVLADDAEIRKLTEPWMAKLQQFLGSTAQERKLQQAYAAE